jgi:hypothetical protein
MRAMRRAIAVLALGVAVLWAGEASAGSLELRGGAFFPRANTGARNDLFVDDSVLYMVEKSDWVGFTGGAKYYFKLVNNVELGFGVDGYSRSVDTAYRDFTTSTNRDILQTLHFTVVPTSVTLRLIPTKRGAIAPFLGVGGDVYYWKYEEYGDFIDFDRPGKPIVSDYFFSDGAAWGFHVTGGIRVPIGDDFSLVAEGRYQWAKADMGDDFYGNKIDLSGASATLGVSIRF